MSMSRADRIRLHEAGRALAVGVSAPEGAPAFSLADALVDFQSGRLLDRVCRSQEGAELLAERLVVDTATCDFRDLLRLPYGTFGHEYAQWMIDHDLHPDLHRDVPVTDSAAPDADERYLAQRVLEVHDFWHVLSGYNCDAAGELGLLAFTLGQLPQRGIASLLLASVREDVRRNWRDNRRPGSPLIPYLWRAFRHGRRARFLVSIAIEDYFWLPIGSVRQRLGIEPSERPLTHDALPPIAVAA